jgi:hypothetical protein
MGVSRSFTLLIVLFCYIIVYISLKIIINYFNPNYLIYLNMYSVYYICFIVTLLLALSFNYYINENNINTIIPVVSTALSQAPDTSSTEPSAPPSSTEPSAPPSSTEPSAPEPSSTEPSSTEPSSTEPSSTEPCLLNKINVVQVINELDTEIKKEDNKDCNKVNKIYRSVIRDVHPDKNPGCRNEAEKVTKQLNNFYDECK